MKYILAFALLVAFTSPLSATYPKTAEAKTITAKKLERKLEASLPVSEVDFFSAKESSGTVVLIPQAHQEPFSSASDPRNDEAREAQEDILLILAELYENYGMDFLMIEGELYGKVSPARIAWIKDKLNTYLAYKDMVSSAQRKLMERELMLFGAGYLMKAKESGLVLYGAEEKDTQNKSKAIVGKYLSIKDSRSAEFAAVKKAMNDIIIEQRNRETAVNMKRALASNREGTGVLVFGALHEKGLVRELNQQGLSVVVIRPASLD